MAIPERIRRINEELRHALASILLTDIRDPRLEGVFLQVNNVAVSKDLSSARVWVSVMAGKAEKKQVLEALKHSRGFIRHELAKRVSLKYMPEVKFELDDSIARAARIQTLLVKHAPPAADPAETEETVADDGEN